MFNEDLPAQVLYLLVRMEKYRWNAERTVAGWKRAKVKDKVFLQHPLIMPFCELLQKHPEEVEKDADVIYNLPTYWHWEDMSFIDWPINKPT